VPEPDSCGAEEPIALFDDLVGAAKQRGRHGEAERSDSPSELIGGRTKLSRKQRRQLAMRKKKKGKVHACL
jgi:hypothetical protein